MSGINSLLNNVRSAANNVAAKVEGAKQEVQAKVDALKPRLPSPIVPDAFERARSTSSMLYNAGASQPGRTTLSRTLGNGHTERFENLAADGSRSFDQTMSGTQARGFAQKAGTVVSAGGDVFGGWKEDHTEVSANGDARSSTASLGLGAEAAAFAGTVNGVKVGLEAGLNFKDSSITRDDLGGGKDLKSERTTGGFYGVMAKAGAQVGTVTGVSVDLFAGARGGGEVGEAIVAGQNQLIGGSVRGMAMMGVGVKADLEAGYDVDKHQARVSGGAGAALLVGGYAGGEVTVGGPDEAPRLDSDLSRAADFVRGRIGG
jgi:hypothetical protein